MKKHKCGDTVWIRGKIKHINIPGYHIKLVGYETRLFYSSQGLAHATKSKNRGW